MDLQNQLSHMKGGSVLVNGTRYEIDMDGIAKDVKDEDAEKMLSNRDRVWSKVKSVSGEEPTPALLDDDGNPATGELASMEIDDLKAMADELGVSYGPNIGKVLLLERIGEAQTKDVERDPDSDSDEDEVENEE